MNKFNGYEILKGLMVNDPVAIEAIAEATLPDLTKQIRFLFVECIVADKQIVVIADTTFKQELTLFKQLLIKQFKDFVETFDDEFVLKRSIDRTFTNGDVWQCLESRIKRTVRKCYFLNIDNKVKREIEIDIIFCTIADDTMSAVKNKLMENPRKTHENGLIYTISRNKVVDYLRKHGAETESLSGHISLIHKRVKDDDNWENKCTSFLQEILPAKEFIEFQAQIKEKYEIILDALQFKNLLSSTERKILILKIISGESHQEIAELLGLKNEDTSKSTQSRALIRIREFLQSNNLDLLKL